MAVFRDPNPYTPFYRRVHTFITQHLYGLEAEWRQAARAPGCLPRCVGRLLDGVLMLVSVSQ